MNAKIVLILLFIIGGVEAYEITFHGIDDTAALYKICRTEALKNSPPISMQALRRRAESDIPNIHKYLLSLGYYDSQVTLQVDEDSNIQYHIEPGPLYIFSSVQVVPKECFDDEDYKCLLICPEETALPEKIIESEEALLLRMTEKGYPLATITKRDVIADQLSRKVSVIFHTEPGPLCSFGPTTITGNREVHSSYIRRKIEWKEGYAYDPCLIESTINALESSALFSCLTISHSDDVDENNMLPMEIQVKESKFRSIGFGLGFSTMRGPGVLAEWEHRNIRGIGERLKFKTNLWRNTQEVTLSYIIPDFRHKRQNLIWSLEAGHEKTEGFTDRAYSFSGIIEKQINSCMRLSYGGMIKTLHTAHSDNNRDFILLKAPVQWRWSNANNFLDPTIGQSLTLRMIPTLQVFETRFMYCINTFMAAVYVPLSEDHRYVLATRVNLGTIIGATRHTIPPSERFYAGSENNLRGYHYLTVSPLDEHHDPIGGRSMMVYSFEFRIRRSEKIGWVLFYDMGNVYSSYIPQFGHKQLQAVGIGLRYHTPLGPLRLDVAVPLNRRKHLDGLFQIYLSIGQAF